jgi:lipopolysaccharide/colanic/teichoic acid biosynthesis glycosyltransferase
MKRLVDLLVAACLLLLFAPVMAIIAVTRKFEGRMPVLYRSPRIGRHGRPFHMLRFRTMVDAPAGWNAEERLTPIGRFIRNHSLDDLPNLFNVLRGEMSIIGPRPTEPALVDLADPEWQRILTARPGMISFAVLRLASTYNTSDQPRRKGLELEYLGKQSTVFDLRVLRAALRAHLVSKGNIKARGRPS